MKDFIKYLLLFLTSIFAQQSLSSAPQMTQTQAYLSVPSLKKKVMIRCSEVFEESSKQHKIMNRCLARERKYNDTHYVFYHGQAGRFRLFQDFLFELMSLLNQENVADDFCPLRDKNVRLRYKTVKKFKQQKHNYFIPEYACLINDHDSSMRKILLSVNLSLFGNTGWSVSGESSWSFFTHNFSIGLPNSKFMWSSFEHMMRNFFASYGFNKKFLKKLMELQKKVMSSGNLVQLFIPKNRVNDLVYLSRPYGKCYLGKIGSDQYGIPKQKHMSTNIAQVLELYKISPRAINDLNELQARVLFTKEGGVLDPKSGCKIFRETLMPAQDLATYRNKLRSVVEDVFADWMQKLIQDSNVIIPRPVVGTQLEKNIEFFRKQCANNKPLIQSKL